MRLFFRFDPVSFFALPVKVLAIPFLIFLVFTTPAGLIIIPAILVTLAIATIKSYHQTNSLKFWNNTHTHLT